MTLEEMRAMVEAEIRKMEKLVRDGNLVSNQTVQLQLELTLSRVINTLEWVLKEVLKR